MVLFKDFVVYKLSIDKKGLKFAMFTLFCHLFHLNPHICAEVIAKIQNNISKFEININHTP